MTFGRRPGRAKFSFRELFRDHAANDRPAGGPKPRGVQEKVRRRRGERHTHEALEATLAARHAPRARGRCAGERGTG